MTCSPEHRIAYIYALRDPDTRDIRYIGFALDPGRRFRQHINPYNLRSHTHKNCWIKNIISNGKMPIMTVLAEVGVDCAAKEEMLWIELYNNSGRSLTNSTKGGSGSFGRLVSKETREKISLSANGRTVNEYQRRRASETFGGKEISAEHRSKISAALKGKTKTVEHRDNISKSHKGKTISQEHRQSISTSLKGRPCSASRRENIRASMHRPEILARISDAVKLSYKNRSVNVQ